VAKLLANMRAAFEQTTALPRADVFGFEAVVCRSWRRVKRPLLALAALSFRCLALAGTASLVAAVAAAVQHYSTNAHALWRFILTLMAERV
jgi:hypothetical protein